MSTVLSPSLSPTKFQIEGLIYMSYVQAAEYNAVTAISGRYTPYNSTLTAPPDASPRAAVAAAAYTTLAYYFPTLAPSLVSTYTDYLNVTLAGFAGRADEWAAHGNERGAQHLVAFQKEAARRDLSLTHTIVQPTIDKATGDAPVAGNEHALRKVGATEHGIVVRGARVLATTKTGRLRLVFTWVIVLLALEMLFNGITRRL